MTTEREREQIYQYSVYKYEYDCEMVSACITQYALIQSISIGEYISHQSKKNSFDC